MCQNRQRSSEKMSSNELRNRVAVQNADFHRPSNAFRLQIADCRLLAATLNPQTGYRLQIAECVTWVKGSGSFIQKNWTENGDFRFLRILPRRALKPRADCRILEGRMLIANCDVHYPDRSVLTFGRGVGWLAHCRAAQMLSCSCPDVLVVICVACRRSCMLLTGR